MRAACVKSSVRARRRARACACGLACASRRIFCGERSSAASMMLATGRTARAPATPRKRPLSDVPVGYEVHVPRMETDGTRFYTWCRVARHVPCSYGDSIVVEIPDEVNQTISLAKLEHEREDPEVDWVRPPQDPVVKFIARSSSSGARMPKRAAEAEVAACAKREAKPKSIHRQAAAAEGAAPRASPDTTVHCCDVQLPLPQYLSASACKSAIGKSLPVYWKSTESGNTLYVLPPGHESETHQVGWTTQHQAPLLKESRDAKRRSVPVVHDAPQLKMQGGELGHSGSVASSAAAIVDSSDNVLPPPEQGAADARIKEALATLEALKQELSTADHSALTIQLYNDELAILNGQPSTGLESLSRALDANRLREQLKAHRTAAFEDALSNANQHPYHGASLARIVKSCDRMGLDPLAALATATATLNSAPYLPAQGIITEAISHLATGKVATFNDAWYPAVQKFSAPEKQNTASLLGAASSARSVGLPRSPSAPQVTAPPLISDVGLLGESLWDYLARAQRAEESHRRRA